MCNAFVMVSTDGALTAREAATVLGCSVPTVSRMARDGRLEPTRTEPFYLFATSDVERVAASREKEPA